MERVCCEQVVKHAVSVQELKLAEMPQFDYQAVRDFALDGWKLDQVHGLEHWRRVERHALVLSLEVRNGVLAFREEVNIKVVRLFAYFHDKCRVSNSFDLKHGERAADMLPSLRNTLLKDLSDHEFAMLSDACRYHTVKANVGEPTIDVCLDADRLDLPRVEIVPDPKLMASAHGAFYAANMQHLKTVLAKLPELWG